MKSAIPFERGVFCNRTLNLHSIRAIGYDMDYTLIHYKVAAWEGQAYEHIKRRLLAEDWPIEKLTFDPESVIRGLIIDKELGNLIKVNRFGYVKRASHGTQPLDFHATRRTYARTIVDLSDDRYVFLNTLFDMSEACIFFQLIDLLDAGKLPGVMGCSDLYTCVDAHFSRAHLEGELKDDIMADPEQYVVLDPDLPLALLDQRHAGKKLLLITNSGWKYTRFMMSYAFDRFLPTGLTWRDVFDVAVVSAGKPEFFSGNTPMFKVVSEEGLLEPCLDLTKAGIYMAGNAAMIEQFLGLSGEQILYIGDHIFFDVNVSKNLLRWRTALILRELEEELHAVETARKDHEKIHQLMQQKEKLEVLHCRHKLALQRHKNKYGRQIAKDSGELESELREIHEKLVQLDDKISPLVVKDSQRFNQHWGYLMRTGNDKSHLTRQIERHADIYTSRVSNLLHYTPFTYFRSLRGSLPHDPVYSEEDVNLPPSVEKVN